jgi:hypothetical protein
MFEYQNLNLGYMFFFFNVIVEYIKVHKKIEMIL